jgi:hemerythrin-like domain-containing protein
MALHTHYPSRSQSLLLGAGLAVLGLAGRKLMVQAPTMLAGDWDKALAAEHKAALALFDALAATDDAASGRRRLMLMQLKHALGKHALEEENAIYPALREHGMEAKADALNGEHGYVKQYLYELSDLLDDKPAFQQKLAKFRADIERHMKQEEQELFPLLRQALDDSATGRLTRRMNQEGLKLA